ncbi:hypothetical protein L7750_01920 [Xenorhabdus bovienii]|uniref:hypothetical protein n=1 Tax=Xenorhabdus bovienii TaxID=40576 RepID=UPI001EE0DE94|nr:hypothetical protein [Xenorhabdus bovienii]MCG3469193.1 hypothetical protein [Xenorhabdus bovienii]
MAPFFLFAQRSWQTHSRVWSSEASRCIVARFKQGNTETPLRRMSAGTADINGYPPLP